MSIYEKPIKTLMLEFVDAQLKPGQQFEKRDVVAWFAKNYPKIKPNTVHLFTETMSVNSTLRKHHPIIRPGSGYDLFFKLSSSQFRLWNSEKDEAPIYASTLAEIADARNGGSDDEGGYEQISDIAAREFALESDLQNYISRNLGVIEAGLKLYEEEGITGLEFPADGRRIDILCEDRNGGFVVIELKVSRGYDRVVGQILRYMAWVKANLAAGKPVRGIIVASEMTNDLKLAASMVSDVSLVEYEISFKLNRVS